MSTMARRIFSSRLATAALAALCSSAAADDWPCYRRDARRSAGTSERLAFPLAARWIREGVARRPAWPEPGRAANPLDFDRAAEPVAAGGLVYIASSADDTLRALHAADGSVAWTYTGDAPLRFAPHIADGRCYLAGDDGAVVCLDARTGAVVWTHRAMPGKRMVSGNGRMISRWPCRSGVLVLDGTVYGTAGMWPAEGTCYFALDAKTGREIWCNDTTDAMYVAYPHDGLSHGGPTPQGYLLSDGRTLVVPTGLSGPAGFDLRTGRFLFWGAKGPGSAWACMGENVVVTAGIGWKVDQDIRLGEAPLWEADDYSCAIRVAETQDSIEFALDAVTPTPDDKDAWTLRFDFRAPSERLGPPGPGCFALVVGARDARLRRYAVTPEAVAPEVGVARAADAPHRILLSVPLDRIRELTGAAPDGFDLAAEIQLFQKERRWLAAKPLTGGRDPMRNGTATFVLAGPPDPASSPWAGVERMEARDLPAHANAWGRTPHHVRHDGNIPVPPLAAELRGDLRERLAALTDVRQNLRYLRGYGCSGTISSATMDFLRSGTLGMYDLADDSGMRNFPGFKPGCRITLLPAMGVLFSAEGNADCFCSYSFATSLALAPAARRRNEDWALYHGPTDAAPVRRYALNLGAPGDRGDRSGTLWLGYPRPPMAFATGPSFGPEPHTLDMPVSMEPAAGIRTVRVNADRTRVADTDVPWISASGLVGVRKLDLGLVYHDPRVECLAFAAEAPPLIDGRLEDACWDGGPGIATGKREGRGRVRIRRDARNIYMPCSSFKRPSGSARRTPRGDGARC
ncbi:MAG: outer membrane protein assembly factor BamB family protein [Planctomycetota bacterium]|jgi:hypothetical protein